MEPMKDFRDLAEKLIDTLVSEADYSGRDGDVEDVLEIIKAHQEERHGVYDLTDGEWIHY